MKRKSIVDSVSKELKKGPKRQKNFEHQQKYYQDLVNKGVAKKEEYDISPVVCI